MTGYVISRTGSFFVSLFIGLSLLFLLLHALPGGETAGLAPSVAADPEALAAVIADQGLDRPSHPVPRPHVRDRPR